MHAGVSTVYMSKAMCVMFTICVWLAEKKLSVMMKIVSLVATQNTCQTRSLHLTQRSELFLLMLILIYVNDIQSDSTCLTLGAETLVKGSSEPSCDFTAQIIANDYFEFFGMFSTRGLIEERNKGDNIYWTLNQSVSVSLAETVPPLLGAHGLHCYEHLASALIII